MEASTRNKLLLGAATIVTLGVAWYGWRNWGWFGGNKLVGWPPPNLECDYTIEENGHAYKFRRVYPSKNNDGTYVAQFVSERPTPQGISMTIERNLSPREYNQLKSCPGVTIESSEAEEIQDSSRSFAVGGKVSLPYSKAENASPASPILKYRTINVVNRFGVISGGSSYDGQIANEDVLHKIGTIFTGREKTIKYKNNGWVTGTVIEVAPNLYIWKKDVVVYSGNQDVKTEFALGGNVSMPVHKNWSYTKVDVWQKTQQGNTVKLSGGTIPSFFKKGDSVFVNMKDASGMSAIATKQEQILDINNSFGWMVVSLYSSQMIPQWVGGVVQKK